MEIYLIASVHLTELRSHLRFLLELSNPRHLFRIEAAFVIDIDLPQVVLNQEEKKPSAKRSGEHDLFRLQEIESSDVTSAAGGSGGILLQKILKIGSLKTPFSALPGRNMWQNGTENSVNAVLLRVFWIIIYQKIIKVEVTSGGYLPSRGAAR